MSGSTASHDRGQSMMLLANCTWSYQFSNLSRRKATLSNGTEALGKLVLAEYRPANGRIFQARRVQVPDRSMEHNTYPGETGTVSLHGLVRVLIDGLNGEMPLVPSIERSRCDRRARSR